MHQHSNSAPAFAAFLDSCSPAGSHDAAAGAVELSKILTASQCATMAKILGAAAKATKDDENEPHHVAARHEAARAARGAK
jgi:hypothetical protein